MSKTLFNWVFDQVEDENKVIVSSQSGDYSYKDLLAEINKYEALLKQLGDIKGKRVAMIVPKFSAFLSISFAVNKRGGIFVPISPMLRSEDLTSLLDLIQPHIIFSVDEVNQFSFKSILLKWAENKQVSLFLSSDCTNWSLHSFTGETIPLEEEPMTLIVCTSGSTGVPKGIVVHLEHLEKAFNSIDTGMKFHKEDHVLIMPPMTSVAGFCSIVGLMNQNIHVLATESYSIPDVLRLMKNHKVNKIFTSPSLFRAIYLFAKNADASIFEHLALVMLVGEPVTDDFIKETQDLNCKIITIFGMSEAGGLLYSPLDVREGIEWNTIPGVEYKLKDPNDEGIGEIVFKPDFQFGGYYKRPDLTKEVYNEGWFLSGDLGRINEDKKLELVGRKKDMIKKGGQQIIPGEVEKVIASHPQVMKAVVVGIPHQVYGEQVIAFVQGDPSLNKQDIYNYLTDKLARFKVPDEILFIEEFPIIQGKVDKITLRKIAMQQLEMNKQGWS
ncbi:acyl-CoA synthetase (AMP-forming)/AMP-acid ligase II [Anoxybacillus vitaminiphilus]|uniref:Acyl-CoA synthetase (AMP-forming)/AMP-acid ligase II n=1 Tax=Paranoxybacillus vitaminiphilus TaxID=581036 RepID=A0A327YT40_9BACL|nr:class I adenylate-forming enzyme family protein [Anoxybacillus vitaminiphilus]RAK23526.1 acyl-CoA synthetase (AMP-forming)/AMP-acid ligase II [Anoxybacillus vitaminiphilus]